MKTDMEKHDLRGAVESAEVEMYRYEEEDGRRVEKPWFTSRLAFNRNGRLTEHVHRNPDGSNWQTRYEYSPSGQLLETKTYDAAGHLSGGVRYTYDVAGRPAAEETISPGGGTATPTVYSYDAGGRRTKIQTLEPGGGDVMIGVEDSDTSFSAADAHRIETHYDGRGLATRMLAYDRDGALVCRVETGRDDGGRLLEVTHYLGDVVSFGPCPTGACSSAEGQPPMSEEQRAELEAELARLFAPGALMSRQTHTYDGQGLLIESRHTMMGVEADRQKFAYDEAGRKVEEATFDESGALQSKAIFTRQYDEHGNWTEEVVSAASSWDAEFGLSTPQHVTRRTIIYY